MSDLDYDIQELFIEGWEAEEIAYRLSLPLARVCAALESFGVAVEDFSPYATVNS